MIRRFLRRWWVRWIVLPLAVLFAAHAGWTLVLMWRFESRLDDLRAAGAPVDLRDLRRPRIQDEDNAAALWAEAHAWYVEHLKPEPEFLNYSEEHWSEEDRPAIRAARTEWLAKGDPYVDLLARAAAKPDMWQDLDWEKGPAMEVTAIPQMQDAARFLEHRVKHGDLAMPEALREISILLDLAPKLERSCLILVLVRWTVEDIAADTLKVLAERPGFDAREARRLLDARFARSDDATDLRKALEGERVIGLSVSRRWIAGESLMRILKELRPDKRTLSDRFWSSWIVRPLAYRDALRLLDLMENSLRLVDLPAREGQPAAEALRKYRRGPPNLFSGLFATLPSNALKNRLRHEARLRVARVGLALLDLRQTTGAWPESLDAVIPMVGAEWIEDPYTGGRLQYEPGKRLEAAVPILDEELRVYDEIVWRFPG